MKKIMGDDYDMEGEASHPLLASVDDTEVEQEMVTINLHSIPSSPDQMGFQSLFFKKDYI